MQTLSLQQSQLMPPRNCNMLMLTKTTKTTAERSAWQQQTNRRRRKFCFALNISICMIIETISALQRLHTQTRSVTHMRTHTHRHIFKCCISAYDFNQQNIWWKNNYVNDYGHSHSLALDASHTHTHIHSSSRRRIRAFTVSFAARANYTFLWRLFVVAVVVW